MERERWNVKVEVDNGAEISSLRDWLLLCFHEKAEYLFEYLFSNVDFQKRTKYMIPTTIGISIETQSIRVFIKIKIKNLTL